MKAKELLLAALLASAVQVTKSELTEAYYAFLSDYLKESKS